MSDVAGRRRTSRSHKTKARIISAAAELLGRHGYELTSLDAVASRAGVTKGTIYYHFDSKEALYEAVLLSYTSEAAEKLEEALRSNHTSPVLALDRIIDIAASEAINPQRRYIYFQEIVTTDPKIHRTVAEATRRYNRVVAQVLKRGQTAGEVIPGNTRVLAKLLLGLIGQPSRWYEPEGEVKPDEFVRLIKTVLFGGFLTQKGHTVVGMMSAIDTFVPSQTEVAPRVIDPSKRAPVSQRRTGRLHESPHSASVS